MKDLFLEGKGAEKAKKLGLTYMKFGRWGKDGRVTAKSKGDDLTFVDPSKNKLTPTKKELPTPTRNEISYFRPKFDPNSYSYNILIRDKINKSLAKDPMSEIERIMGFSLNVKDLSKSRTLKKEIKQQIDIITLGVNNWAIIQGDYGLTYDQSTVIQKLTQIAGEQSLYKRKERQLEEVQHNLKKMGLDPEKLMVSMRKNPISTILGAVGLKADEVSADGQQIYTHIKETLVQREANLQTFDIRARMVVPWQKRNEMVINKVRDLMYLASQTTDYIHSDETFLTAMGIDAKINELTPASEELVNKVVNATLTVPLEKVTHKQLLSIKQPEGTKTLVYNYGGGDWANRIGTTFKFTEKQRDSDNSKYYKSAIEHSKWRWQNIKQPHVRKHLFRIQKNWQRKGQHDEKDVTAKIKRNKFLDTVMKGPPPVQVSIDNCIERGMSIKSEEIETFLSQFKVGEMVHLPPSGFTPQWTLARSFALPGTGTIFADKEDGTYQQSFQKQTSIGVVYRIFPKDGKVYGLALSHPNNSQNRDEKDFYSTEYDIQNTYDDESEIIRPSWARNKVVGINRIINFESAGIIPQITYEIIMQEEGSAEKLQESIKKIDKEEVKKWMLLMLKYVNSSVRGEKTKEQVNEGKAATLAHKQGLTYSGGGTWIKNGVPVAKTKGDELVKLSQKTPLNQITHQPKGEPISVQLQKLSPDKQQKWKDSLGTKAVTKISELMGIDPEKISDDKWRFGHDLQLQIYQFSDGWTTSAATKGFTDRWKIERGSQKERDLNYLLITASKVQRKRTQERIEKAKNIYKNLPEKVRLGIENNPIYTFSKIVGRDPTTMSNPIGIDKERISLAVALINFAQYPSNEPETDMKYWDENFNISRKEAIKLVSLYNVVKGKANFKNEDVYKYAKIDLEKDKQIDMSNEEILRTINKFQISDRAKDLYKKFIPSVDTNRTYFYREGDVHLLAEKTFTYDWSYGSGKFNPDNVTKGEIARVNYEQEAIEQSEWRQNMPKGELIKLYKVQNRWQQDSQYNDVSSTREERNNFLNRVLKGPPPALFRTKEPIERGMTIDIDSFNDFISQFKVGQNIKMPPSGFTSDLTVSRGYAANDGPSKGNIGVLLRVLPKDDKVYGLTLGHAFAKAPTDIKMDHGLELLTVDDEQEIIRPGWANNKVIEINKVVTALDDPSMPPALTYEIVMQEEGIDDSIKEQLMRESTKLSVEVIKSRWKIFIRYLNNSVRQPTKEKDDRQSPRR